MNKMWILASLVLLNACALTPEQQAQRAHEQKLYEQNIQIMLASQCDKETADLMKQHFDEPKFATEQEHQAFRVKYIDKINEPMFQACYKMAWQNYISQQQLRHMRHRLDDAYWGWRPFGFYPWAW